MRKTHLLPGWQHHLIRTVSALYCSHNLRAGSLLGAFVLGAISPPAYGATLENWQFDPTTSQLEITVRDGTTPRYFLLAQPLRIVLDLPNTQIGAVTSQQAYSGAVRQIRVSQFQPDITRIVVELSPDVVLSSEKVQLQPVGSERASNRWRLRPVIAQAPAVAPTTPVNLGAAPAASQLPPANLAPQPSVTVRVPSLSPAGASIATPPSPLAPAQLVPPPVVPPVLPSSSTQPAGANLLEPGSLAIPRRLPPAIFSPLPPATVSVPPLGSTVPSVPQIIPEAPSRPAAIAQPTPPTLPAAIAAPPPATPIIIPVQPPAQQSSFQPSVVEFGQPLPESAPTPRARIASPQTPSSLLPPLEPGAIVLPVEPPPAKASSPSVTASPPVVEPGPSAIAPIRSVEFSPSQSSPIPADVLLLAGTQLRLRYPGTEPLTLQASPPREEVLLLHEAVRDRNGTQIFAAGAQVIGRFETTSGGSRFVVQAVALPNRNIALPARSDILSGGRRVSENQLLRNSGIGALAGVVLGGLSEGNVLGGAAAAAAVTYLSAPRPATLQPNQIIPVLLTEDLRRF